MTDMRRTLLWGVFLISLFLLYDAWNKHTGQPSLFGPAARPTTVATTPAASGVPSAALPTPAELGRPLLEPHASWMTRITAEWTRRYTP